MVEIGVAFGYIVVIAAIAVVLVGVVMLFIVSIKGDFAEHTPRDHADADAADRYDRAG